jgi:hypothetical protein
MWQKVRTEGFLTVIVGLNLSLKPLGYLSPEERMAQRRAILAAQDQVLGELAGTQYTLIHRYNNVDALALRVGPDALAVLEKSSLVAHIKEDWPPGEPL